MRAGMVLFLFVLVGPMRDLAEASEWVRSAPAFHEEAGRTWEDLKQRLEDWGLYLRDHFDFPTRATERPLITFMLSQREKLALSSGQVKSLEGLRDAFRRQAIRSEADLKVAEMDLAALLEADPVDLGKVEIKVREIERLKSDLRLARLRAIEESKEVLSQDQRAKLKELLVASQRGPFHARSAQRP